MEQQSIINAVHGATALVFDTLLGMGVESQPVRIETCCPPVRDGVMSLISLAGPWAGTGAVTCNVAFACRICSIFSGTETDTINEEVLDCVGELTNMIIGNFKTEAEQVLGPLDLGIPTVIYGLNFRSRSLGGNDWLVMPFTCGDASFEVRLCFRPAQEFSSIRHHAELMAV